MKYGFQMIRFLSNNQDKIKQIEINGDEHNGFLKITLVDNKVKIFDKWDPEDQGLFACCHNGEQWDPSKRGIPKEFHLTTASTSLTVSVDKPINYSINGEPVSSWGEKVNPTTTSSNSVMWKKKETTEAKPPQQPEATHSNDSNEETYCGLKRGFLG